MSKKSFFAKSSAFAFGVMLMAACTNIDSPVIEEPADSVITTTEDLTSLVATDGWGQGGFAGSWAAPEVDTKDGRHSGLAEIYNGSNDGIAATGIIMQQEIKGLANGLYTVELYANSLYTPNRGFDSDMADGATDVAFVFANEVKVPIVAKVAETTSENGLYTLEVNVTDGILKLGLEKEKAGTNWHTIQIKSLSITKEVALSELYGPLVEEANALLNEKISEEAKAVLTAALTAPKSEEGIAELSAAISAAKVSAASYELIAAGSIPDDKLDNWTCTTGNTFHINTWSGEGNTDGSGMVTPFIEDWRNAGEGTLGDGEIAYTLAGLNPGEKITVSALIRAYSEAGNAISGGIFFVGSEKVSLSDGHACEAGAAKGVFNTYTATGTVGTDGVLKFGVSVSSATFNWIAIKSVTLKK